MWEAFALADPDHVRRKELSLNQFGDDLGDQMEIRIRSMLDRLVNMERIEENLRVRLVGSIGAYLAAARLVSYGDIRFHEKLIRFLRFWRDAKATLVDWFEFVKISLLHHPNSCGCERLFSVLKYVLTSEREHALDDYIRAAVYSIYDIRDDGDRLRGEIID